MRQVIGSVVVFYLAVFCGEFACGEESLLPGVTILTTGEQLRELSERALERLMRGEMEGFKVLAEHETDPKSDAAVERYFRAQADRVKEFSRKYGQALGFERVAEHRVSDCFRRYVYVAKYEKSFLRWAFTYYRPRETWKFLRVDFDDDVNTLFFDVQTSAPAAETEADAATDRP